MSTQQMVFNDNYWGPARENAPELQEIPGRNREPALRINTQTVASPLTYSHTIGAVNRPVRGSGTRRT